VQIYEHIYSSKEKQKQTDRYIQIKTPQPTKSESLDGYITCKINC